MMHYEKEMNFDKMLHVLNNDYNSSDDGLELMIQNILGFSIAITIQFLRDKIKTNDDFNETILKSFFWFFIIDKLIINMKRNKFNKDKKEALEQIHKLTSNLKKAGINVDETDVLRSIKEKINSKVNYYYMIDMFNTIVPVARKEQKDVLFNKTITWSEGLDGYNHISFYKIGSIATDNDDKVKVFGEKEKVNKEDYKNVKTYYELGYKQDDNIGIITFCRDNDDIRIIGTEGDIEKASVKEKYLKIGMLLQDIKYKNSYEINGIIKKKIHS